MALAASVLLAVGLATLAPRLWMAPSPPVEGPATTFQYVTARGEMRDVRLPDGSVVTLDADSAVSGRFTDGKRALTLQNGRARFAVAPNHARPFVVAAGPREVVAVGTKFDVDLAAGTLTVTVLEGRVTVGSRDGASGSVALSAGQRIIDRGDRPVAQAAPAEDAESWRGGVIAFDNQTVAEAVTVMNRYGGQRVLTRDPKIGALRVSGQFRAGEGDRFAATLADVHGLRVVRRSDGLELVRPK
jgi:transmembrane sensor